MKRMVLATLALAASAASWADVGVYGGANLGRVLSDVSCSGDAACDIDKNATGWKIYGGYHFTPIVGAELTYFDFGKNHVTRTIVAGAVNDDFKTSAVGIGADFHFDLAPKWSTDMHLGYARVKSKTSLISGASVNSAKNTPYVGLDAGFLATKGLRIRAGWDFSVAIDPVSRLDYHVNLFSAGASFEF